MAPAYLPDAKRLVREWNQNAMRTGRIDNGNFEVDLGSVLPGALAIADLADVLPLLAPRPFLFANARDGAADWAVEARERFRRAAGPAAYRPGQHLDAALLVRWLADTGR
jgi:hypothetical protein